MGKRIKSIDVPTFIPQLIGDGQILLVRAQTMYQTGFASRMAPEELKDARDIDTERFRTLYHEMRVEALADLVRCIKEDLAEAEHALQDEQSRELHDIRGDGELAADAWVMVKGEGVTVEAVFEAESNIMKIRQPERRKRGMAVLKKRVEALGMDWDTIHAPKQGKMEMEVKV